ncbi:hypothetical protein BZA77DRAFT_353538 [Pyronema omphalodes]|nr:hypothetical protein BZA77DRAFT_353538 [Pyronema omphalodes]
MSHFNSTPGFYPPSFPPMPPMPPMRPMPTFRPAPIPQLPTFPRTHTFRDPVIPRPRRPSFVTEHDLDSLSDFFSDSSSDYSSSDDEYDSFDDDDEYDNPVGKYRMEPKSRSAAVLNVGDGKREGYAPRPVPRPTSRPAPRAEGPRLVVNNQKNPTGKAYMRPDFDNRL